MSTPYFVRCLVVCTPGCVGYIADGIDCPCPCHTEHDPTICGPWCTICAQDQLPTGEDDE